MDMMVKDRECGNGMGYNGTASRVGVEGVRRSFAPTMKRYAAPSGTGHPVKYGDRIEVRMLMGMELVAEFTEMGVNDFTELLGVARRYARGRRGLTRLYIRNRTRGWTLERPFMLYLGSRDLSASQQPAHSFSRPTSQPQGGDLFSGRGRREIPESIRLLYGEH